MPTFVGPSKTYTNKDLNKFLTRTQGSIGKVYTNKDLDTKDDFIPDSDEDFTEDTIEDDFIPDEPTTESTVQNESKNDRGFWTTPLTNAPSEFVNSLNIPPSKAKMLMDILGQMGDDTTSPLGIASMAAGPILSKVGGPMLRGASRGMGGAIETTGKFIRRHTPFTGMPIISPMAGRNLQKLERLAGKGMEYFGNKIRQMGHVIEPPPPKVPLAEQIIPEEMSLPVTAKSAKPKIRANTDGTFLNYDSGEIVDSGGKAMGGPTKVPKYTNVKGESIYADEIGTHQLGDKRIIKPDDNLDNPVQQAFRNNHHETKDIIAEMKKDPKSAYNNSNADQGDIQAEIEQIRRARNARDITPKNKELPDKNSAIFKKNRR